MNEVYSKALADIQGSDDERFGPNGGFTAVLSTPSLDRDGDRLAKSEWMNLPDRLPLDIDHGMSVADTVGSFHPYFDGDKLMMDAYFSSLPRAQEVRTLVNEGHVGSVSVAFMTDKSKKDGEPNRELLNAGIVAIPSNRDALILATKAAHALRDALNHTDEGEVPQEITEAVLGALKAKKPKKTDDDEDAEDAETKDDMEGGYCDVDEEDTDDKSADKGISVKVLPDFTGFKEALVKGMADAIGVKAPQGQSAGSGDRAMLQAIHDASVHMGAICIIPLQGDEDPTGAADGANKSADEADTKDLESFEKALDDVLSPEDSPVESPAAEAAAPSVEERAPADEAADDAADELANRARAAALQLSMLS